MDKNSDLKCQTCTQRDDCTLKVSQCLGYYIEDTTLARIDKRKGK